RRYFTAMGKKDLDGVMAEWDPKAPRFAEHKQWAKKLFAETGPVTVKDLTLTFTGLWDDTARVHARVTLEGTETKPGTPHGKLPGGTQVVELAWENESWKIRDCESLNAYYVVLFVDRLQTAAARRGFLAIHPELGAELGLVFTDTAFSLVGTKEF